MPSTTDSEDTEWQAAAYEQFLRDDSAEDLVYEEAWAAEVERRQSDIDTQEASLLPGPETVAKIKNELDDKAP